MMASEFTPPAALSILTPAGLVAISDDDLEGALITYVVEKALPDPNDPAAVAALPSGLRAWYLTFVVDAQVLNGGFNQLFFNPTGALVPDAPAALTSVGIPEAADLVTAALYLLGEHAPALEAAVEAGTVEAFMETYIDQPFAELDNAYGAAQETFRLARIRFVREQATAFTHP